MALCATEKSQSQSVLMIRLVKLLLKLTSDLRASVCALGQVADTARQTDARLYIPKQGEGGATRWRRRCHRSCRLLVRPAPPYHRAATQPDGWPRWVGWLGGWRGVNAPGTHTGRAVCQISLIWVSSAAEGSLWSVLSSPHRPGGLTEPLVIRHRAALPAATALLLGKARQ